MVEMTIVLVMIGILTAALAPMLLRQHTGTLEERDRVALLDMKTAIISYATTFGGIPDPVASEVPNVPAFGVNRWGAFGSDTSNLFRLDVNDALKSSCIKATDPSTCAMPGATTGGDRVVFCQAVSAQMKLVTSPLPAVCENTDNRTTAACAAASAIPVAFVLYSTGNDRSANQENNEVTGFVPNNRIYENDKRGINNTPGDDHYDDQVMSYPVSALARDCREKMGIAVEVMNCAPGQKYLGSITNNSTAQATYFIGAASAVVPANGFTSYVNLCQAGTVAFGVNVAATTPTMSLMDPNADGRVDVVITSAVAGTFTYQ